MGQKQDIETILSNIKTILTDNLSSKLIAITTDKSNDITLPDIDSNAYALQSLQNKIVMNYNPFIFYGIQNINNQSVGARISEELEVFIIICFYDSNNDLDENTVSKRAFRYLRALREIFEEHWADILTYGKIYIDSLVPIELSLMNSNQNHRAVGVNLKIAIV